MNSTVEINRAIKGEFFIVLGLEIGLLVALHLVGGPTHHVPLDELGRWFSSTDPTTALVALARLAGLAIGYWLLATTLLYALAHNLGLTVVADALRWVTLPVIRRAVHGFTAVSLTGASILGPTMLTTAPALAEDANVASAELTESAGDTSSYQPGAAGFPGLSTGDGFWQPAGPADAGAPAYRPRAAGRSEAGDAEASAFWRPGAEQPSTTGNVSYQPGAAGFPTGIDGVADGGFWRPSVGEASTADDGSGNGSYEPSAAGWPDNLLDGQFWRPHGESPGASPAAPQGPALADQQSAEASAADGHVVSDGENLWGIAERQLQAVTGRSVTEDEVAQYWTRVIAANKASLRSGDPDVIHPGERISLPAVYSE